jgi:hypothetical protein
VAAYGRLRDGFGDRLRYRVGAFTLVEQGTALPDDVALGVLDLQLHPAWRTRVGAHAYGMRDRSGGGGGLLGSGPTSTLSALQGGPALDLSGPDGVVPEVDADLLWLMLDGGFNHRLDQGPLGASALALWNLGALRPEGQDPVAVAGWMVGAEGRWRWTRGSGSVARAEVLLSSRDGAGRDRYTGVLSGNSWGVAGATWASHGCLLLFSDPGAISRQIAVVSDVSNGGAGLRALAADLGFDPVPHRLTASIGGGHARDAEGAALGTELHARLGGALWPLARLGVAGAVVRGSAQPADPVLLLLSFDWLGV